MSELPEPFDPLIFLTHAGLGRKLVQIDAKATLFTQGEPADSVFYLQTGRARLTVLSSSGKQATISLSQAGDFVGEEAAAAVPGLRLSTCVALNPCLILQIQRKEILRVIHEEHAFSDLFVAFLLARSMRIQADLVAQLFDSSEKRLARVLLLMAEYGSPGEAQTLIPRITHEALADLVGTTRPRISFFMNRFRSLGLIEYNGRIRVHRSLLNVVLHDLPPATTVGDEPPCERKLAE